MADISILSYREDNIDNLDYPKSRKDYPPSVIQLDDTRSIKSEYGKSSCILTINLLEVGDSKTKLGASNLNSFPKEECCFKKELFIVGQRVEWVGEETG